MVEKPIDQAAGPADGRVKDDHPAARGQDPLELQESGARVAQVVPDIEKDQVGDTPVGKIEPVGILLAVEPRIRKQVRSDAIRDHLLYGSHSRAEFDDLPLDRAVEPRGDQLVELAVHRLQ